MMRIWQVAAYPVAPCAPTTAAYTSGLAREPNEFRFTSRTSAQLKVRLDFNPTLAREGPLAQSIGCLQRDVKGIENTPYRQFPLQRSDGMGFNPATSAFLRRYDPDTGFELKGRGGRPRLVRSPNKALAFLITSHVDRTTHGITPGRYLLDHHDLMLFPLEDVVVGSKMVWE